MKLTVLTENTSNKEGIYAEHGLSLYIETGSIKLLFDMGQTDLFAKNAETLGIDLKAVDIAIISHGHYDHGGGLETFFKLNEKAPVYINQNAFGPHYNGTQKYIGLDVSLKDNPRLIYTKDFFRISDSLCLFSYNEKERKNSFESFGLMKKSGNDFVPDDFCHEQYLLIEENSKRIVISGCSHKGIIDIVDWTKPDVLVGGFHFSKMPLGDELKSAAEKLNSYKTAYYTCHCTGTDQFNFMKNYIKELKYISCGEKYSI